MKAIENLFFGILGIGFIAFAIYSILFPNPNRDMSGGAIFGLFTFGAFLLWSTLKGNKKTTVEKFIEKYNVNLPLWGERVLSFVIDFIIVLIIYSLSIIFIDAVFDVRLDKLYDSLIVFLPFFVFYYSIQEFLYETTIGKRVFKLKVISTNEKVKLSFEQVFIRAMIVLIPLNFFFFLSNKPIGLHDILSKTIVVNNKEQYGK